MSDKQQSQKDHAGVRVPPPIIFLLPLLAGLAYDSAWALGTLAALGWMLAGGPLVAVGLALLVASAPRHKKAGTNIEPWKPTTAIIDDGIYGYSRNPIYLGMAFVCAGIAVAAGSFAALVLLIPCLVVIRFYVIGREEAYLEAKFGDEYRDYMSRVRRWI